MKRKKVISIILSIIFALFMVIGNSFKCSNSFGTITKHTILSIFIFIILIIIFCFLINKLFTKLDNLRNKENKPFTNKILKLFDEHPFVFSLIFILVFWLIYIICFYPIILSPDPSFQIRQYFGIPNKYSTYSIMLDENVLITNHHPVIHTLLLGTCLKIGTLINNHNLGLFIYSIIQILILSCTLSYTIKFMKKINMSSKFRFIYLLIYALVPVFPFYAMSAVKDVIFGCLVILYIIKLYEFSRKDFVLKNTNMIKTILLLILIVLFRNNGIYVILLSFPLLLLLKTNFKKYLLIFLTIICFNVTYNKIILPYFKITPTSIREVLSIPFQQTARYVKYHEKELDSDEKEAISKILKYDTLKDKYKPEISDPVKNDFNRYYTSEDLTNYFKAWLKGLTKEPITYVEATVNNIYGYFYPLKTNWYFYYKFDSRITENDFDYHYNNLKNTRNVLSTYGTIFPYIPVIGLIVNIGFNVWLIFIMTCYFIYKKYYKDIIYLMPSIISILICVASPVNTYFRYTIPFIFSMLVQISIFISIIKRSRLK